VTVRNVGLAKSPFGDVPQFLPTERSPTFKRSILELNRSKALLLQPFRTVYGSPVGDQQTELTCWWIQTAMADSSPVQKQHHQSVRLVMFDMSFDRPRIISD
jgi:hypothetical protein